jgi:hypothetical protein
MAWASKYNDDEVIECGLQLVDLYNRKQNSADQILSYVQNSDFISALKLVKSIEKDERKFIMYMLCIMEITPLNAKVSENSKTIIENLLIEMVKNLPTDFSWDGHFSSYIVFKIAYHMYILRIDFEPILKMSEYWHSDLNWIESNGPYSKEEIIVLQNIIKHIEDEEVKKRIFNLFLLELAKQNEISIIKSLIKSLNFNNNENLMSAIAETLAKNNNIKKSIVFALKIKDYSELNDCLLNITKILLKKDKISAVFELYPHFSMHYYRVSYFCELSNYFFEKRNNTYNEYIKHAEEVVSLIENNSWLLMAKRKIALAYISQRKYKKAQELINETFVLDNANDKLKDFGLISIIEKLAKVKKYNLALKIVREITNNNLRGKEFIKILLLKRKTKEELFLLSKWENFYEFDEDKIDLIKYLLEYKKKKFLFQLCRELNHIGDVAITFMEKGEIDHAFKLMKSFSKKIWNNPKKQIIQLLLEEKKFDDIFYVLGLIRNQSSSSEWLEFFNWIFENIELNNYEKIINGYGFDQFIKESKNEEIKKIYLNILKYRIKTTSQDIVLKEISFSSYREGNIDLLFLIIKEVKDLEEQIKIIELILKYELESRSKNLNKCLETLIKLIEVNRIGYNRIGYINLLIAKIHLETNEKSKFDQLIDSIPIKEITIENELAYPKLDLLVNISSLYLSKYGKIEFKRYLEFIITEIKKLKSISNEKKCFWLNDLAKASIISKDFEIANNLINEALTLLSAPYDIEEDSCYTELASILVKLDRSNEAIEVIEKLDGNIFGLPTIFYFFLIIEDIISIGNNKFLDYIQSKIKNNEELTEFYIYCFQGWYDNNNFNKFNLFYKNAINLVLQINDEDKQFLLLEKIVKFLEYNEEYVKLNDLFEKIPQLKIKLALARLIGFDIARDERVYKKNILKYCDLNSHIKDAIWRGVLGYKWKRYNLDSKTIFNNIKKLNMSEETLINLLEYFFYKKIFINSCIGIDVKSVERVFDIQWAIEIKNRIN